jgi:hypothetical protein
MRAPVLALILLGVATAGCATGDDETRADDRPVVVSTREGTVRGVGIGDWPADVERVFGRRLGSRGFVPFGEVRFAGPQTIHGGGDLYQYRDFVFLAASKVFALGTTADGAATEKGVGVGDPLTAIREAYPETTCGEYDYGETGHPWCRTLVGPNLVFFGDDPVTSITVVRTPADCWAPRFYGRQREEVCGPRGLLTVVDERAGVLRGVRFGDAVAEVRRRLGRTTDDEDGFFPAGTSFTGPPSIPTPASDQGTRAPPATLHFRDTAYLVSPTAGVFAMATLDERARTKAGVAVGDELARVREAYPRFQCGRADYGGEGRSYQWCRTQVGRIRAFFGANPIESITLAVTAAR